MSDSPTETHTESGKRSRSRRIGAFVVLLLLTIGTGAVVVWRNNALSGGSSGPTADQTAAQLAAPAAPRAEPSEDAIQSLNALRQSVKDLEASRQHMADQLDEIKRQLEAEQGEQKMLSEQVGALSGRVDSLAKSSAASVITRTPENALAKKRR